MNIFLLIVFTFGSIGAYAMALGMLVGAKRALAETEPSAVAVLGVVFPGIVYALGYSVLGFFWGLMIWRFFAEDGPVRTAIGPWRTDTAIALEGTVVIAAGWSLVAWVLS